MSTPLKIPKDQLTIVSFISKGGQGHVYRGTWQRSSQEGPRDVALKWMGGDDSQAQCLRELAAVEHAQDHAHLIKLYGYSDEVDGSWSPLLPPAEGGRFLLVMELASGMLSTQRASLKRLQETQPATHCKLILHYAVQIVSGLQHLHSNSVIHLDLKPQNVLCFPNNVVKLCDFGISKRLSETDTIPTGRCTAAYSAPEMLMHQPGENGDLVRQPNPVSVSTDLYSVGALLCEMFCGCPPWGGKSPLAILLAVSEGKSPSAEHRTWPQSCSQELIDLITSLLSFDPDARGTLDNARKLLTKWYEENSEEIQVQPAHSQLDEQISYDDEALVNNFIDGVSLSPLIQNFIAHAAEDVDRNGSHIEILTTLKVRASRLGDIDVMSALLQLDAHLDFQDISGWSPLCAAVHEKQIEMIRVLHENGVNFAFNGSPTGAAIHVAIEEGHVDVLELLLHYCPVAVSSKNNAGKFPIYFAIGHDRSAVLRALIERMPGRASTTHLLHVAAENGSEHCCRTLLELEARVDADVAGSQPIHRASANGHEAVVKLLLDSRSTLINEQTSDDGSTPLFGAAIRGHTHVVKLLMQRGGDASLARNDGLTPLMAASENGHDEVVSELLSAIPQENRVQFVNQRATAEGRTAMHYAASGGHAEVILHLRIAGADVNLPYRDSKGKVWNPLLVAAFFGHDAAVKALCKTMEGRAANGGESEENEPPMNAAARRAHATVIETLYAHNFSVNGFRSPPLVCAAKQAGSSGEFGEKLLATMQALLRFGALVNDQGPEGRTALHWAVAKQDEQVVALLRRHNADPHLPHC